MVLQMTAVLLVPAALLLATQQSPTRMLSRQSLVTLSSVPP